jgi:diguanylate cyclase (GGDEF)-like protein/PAS domain S-box-containing protein
MGSQLASFGQELAECESLSEVLAAVAHRAAALVGEGSVLAIVSDDGTMLEPAAFHHDDPTVLATMRQVLASEPYPVGTGVAGRVVAQRAPIVLDAARTGDLAEQVASVWRPFAKQYPIRALMIVPMFGYGEVVGTLGVLRVDSEDPYTNEALLALEALADRAGLAIAETRRAPHRLTPADLEAIFQHSVDGVLFTMPNGRVLAANPAACSILRRSERDICQTGRQGLVVDDERARHAVAARTETGRARTEITMRRGDGSQFVADVSSTVFTNESGEVRACVTFRDVTDQVRLRAELEEKTALLARLSAEDDLTKLRNRRGFLADAARLLAIADREDEPVQVVFFDVNGLKYVNDHYGHDTGDDVLRRLAAAIEHETRAGDVTARLGGDEFVALLFAASTEEAEATVQRITDAISDLAPTAPGPRFSYGIVQRPSGSTTSLDHFLHEADQRMYSHKARAASTSRDEHVPQATTG